MNRRMEHRPIEEHDVVRDFFDSQVGPKRVMAVCQDDVGFMKTLGVVVADVEERDAIGEGIAPENLIHRQLADEIRFGTVFAVALDANDQVTDVIIYSGSGNRRREVAMQTHGTISGFLGNRVSCTRPTRLRRHTAAGFCRPASSPWGTCPWAPCPQWPRR